MWILYYRDIHYTSYIGNQLNSMGHNHHSYKCAFMEKLGNQQVEIERMGGNMDQKNYFLRSIPGLSSKL